MSRILLLISLLGLASCGVSSGSNFNDENLSKLVRGSTTYGQAVQLLGPPEGVTKASDGSMVAGYQYTRTSQSTVDAVGRMIPIVGGVLFGSNARYSTITKFATLMFDSGGILRDWNFQASGTGDLVARAVGAARDPAPVASSPTYAASPGALPAAMPLPGLDKSVGGPSVSDILVANGGLGSLPQHPNAATQSDHRSSERRVALVIGNSAYRYITPLRNSANDAQSVARMLQRLGYTLVGNGPQLNLDRSWFERVLVEFGHAIPGATVAMFYYAGHGMQVDGSNWLVPVDAEITPRKQDLPFRLLSADHVLLQMDGAGAQLNVLILDACRNNPLAALGTRDMKAGLAEMRAPAGSMIAYATQPGNVALDGDGANSPYSAALVDAMQQPDLEVFHLFNRVGLKVQRETDGAQVPWTSNSPINTDVRLSGPGPG